MSCRVSCPVLYYPVLCGTVRYGTQRSGGRAFLERGLSTPVGCPALSCPALYCAVLYGTVRNAAADVPFLSAAWPVLFSRIWRMYCSDFSKYCPVVAACAAGGNGPEPGRGGGVARTVQHCAALVLLWVDRLAADRLW